MALECPSKMEISMQACLEPNQPPFSCTRANFRFTPYDHHFTGRLANWTDEKQKQHFFKLCMLSCSVLLERNLILRRRIVPPPLIYAAPKDKGRRPFLTLPSPFSLSRGCRNAGDENYALEMLFFVASFSAEAVTKTATRFPPSF